MVYYYSIKIKNPGIPLTKEQDVSLKAFVSQYHARVIPGKQITLDFQYPKKLIPVEIRKELKGLEILSISC